MQMGERANRVSGESWASSFPWEWSAAEANPSEMPTLIIENLRLVRLYCPGQLGTVVVLVESTELP